ncbi:MAG: amino acid carrier protein, partial [Zetaproteobacteria bacterium]|nr:amino acid carrier protein [Zetaproteobacteria bacterium]
SPMVDFILAIKKALWAGPLLLLFASTGIMLSWRLRLISVRKFGAAMKLLLAASAESRGQAQPARGELSRVEALMTGLAGAVGTGNIAGIALAISVGGAGSLFWMWVVAFLGMATAYAEASLGLCYRRVDARGASLGGPMVTLADGLGWQKMATVFALLAVIASFGIGSTIQANSVASGIFQAYGLAEMQVGVVMAVLAGLVILGGVQSIGRTASFLVPLMSLIYVGAGLVILATHVTELPLALWTILQSAFSWQAAVGGGVGFLVTLENGVANGIFANEAGMGSLSIAAASSTTPRPSEQGLLAMAGVFLATMVICTITGLVILVTGADQWFAQGGRALSGSALTMDAFGSFHPALSHVVVFGLVCFAFTTTIAWAHYGERCLTFMFGQTSVRISNAYYVIYILSIMLGAVMEVEVVWALANLANGLMAIPNLLSLWALRGEVETMKG